jgi:hypothetical protein
LAAQQELARRARANTEDLTAYFASRQRAEEVDDWLAERVSALGVQADARRAEHVRRCGVALAAMQSRGETVRDIARMTGIGENSVREMILAASNLASDNQPSSPPSPSA